MGIGFSAELGKDSLCEETKLRLDRTLKLLRSNDPDTTILDLSNSGVAAQGVEVGGPALAKNTTIEALDLSYNNLLVDGMVSLTEHLKENKSLRLLNLAGNEIYDEGANVVAQYLQQDPPIEELCLYHNGITDKGVCEIINALQVNTNLVALNLSMNECTAKTVIMLAQLLKVNDTLSHVLLNGNPINLDADPKRFGQLEIEIQEKLAANEQRVLKQREARRVVKQKEARRALKEEEDKQQREQEKREADERIAAEIRAREEDQKREAALHQQMEQEMERKRQRDEAKAAENDVQAQALKAAQWTQRAMDQAYAWRQKLTNNGQFVKEWRNGFTLMTTAPGDPPGAAPRLSSEIPRLLKPSWSDPDDPTNPRGGTLHYNCKYQKDLEKDEDGKVRSADLIGPVKYGGCCGAGFRCASIGFAGTRALPDLSAANFFASRHPAPPVE